MSITIGEAIKSMVFGFTAGLVASIILLSCNEVYGASVGMTRFYIAVVCSIACIVAEIVCNTSAREVAVDVVISALVSMFSVGENFLNSQDKLMSIRHMFGPILFSVIIAAFFSNTFAVYSVKFFELKPFNKGE